MDCTGAAVTVAISEKFGNLILLTEEINHQENNLANVQKLIWEVQLRLPCPTYSICYHIHYSALKY